MTFRLAFASPRLEDKFDMFIRINRKEEVGGVLFWDYGNVYGMHWKRHDAIFGRQSIGFITDWLVCPNVSNIRNREYTVSDLKQFIGIAEQTAYSRDCYFLHFHSHPGGNSDPSDGDKGHWLSFWNQVPIAHGVIAALDGSDRLQTYCHQVVIHEGKYKTVGESILWWEFIKQKVKRYERQRGITIDKSRWYTR